MLKEVVRAHHSTGNGSINTLISKITSCKTKQKELLVMMQNMDFPVKNSLRTVISGLGKWKKAINYLI